MEVLIRRKQSLENIFEKHRNSLEFVKSLLLQTEITKKTDITIISEYLDNLSYLHSLKPMPKQLQICYSILAISIFCSEICKAHCEKTSNFLQIQKDIFKISKILSKIYFLPPQKIIISIKTEKLCYELIEHIRELIKYSIRHQSKEEVVKLNLISQILCMTSNNSLEVTLKGLMNVKKGSMNSHYFPNFLNEKSPYLVEYASDKRYTLVLDLDETLIHVKDGVLLIRPGTPEFISKMSIFFELVLFTAAKPDYTDLILAKIDPNHLIKFRLYRKHTNPGELVSIKNLSDLGRNLKTTIIIDNFKESFALHPKNGLQIQSWLGNSDDTKLYELVPILQKLCESQTEDVTSYIPSLNYCS